MSIGVRSRNNAVSSVPPCSVCGSGDVCKSITEQVFARLEQDWPRRFSRPTLGEEGDGCDVVVLSDTHFLSLNYGSDELARELGAAPTPAVIITLEQLTPDGDSEMLAHWLHYNVAVGDAIAQTVRDYVMAIA